MQFLAKRLRQFGPKHSVLELAYPYSDLAQEPKRESHSRLPHGQNVSVLLSGGLESCPNPPREFMRLLELLSDDSLLALSAPFHLPYTPGGQDLWRFTPEALRSMAEEAGFTVLEGGWLPSDSSPLSKLDREGAKSAYVVLSKAGPVGPQISISSTVNNMHSAQNDPRVALGTYRCLFLNSYYDQYVSGMYNNNPTLQSLPYSKQLEALVRSRFGDSDFYSEGLNLCGWTSDNLIMNAPSLQRAWAREHGLNLASFDLVLAQVDEFQPDVLYVQDMHCLSASMLDQLRSKCRLLVGQIASTGRAIPYEKYDCVFSSLPGLVQLLRAQGVDAYLQPLAFAPQLLSEKPSLATGERDVSCSFVGTINGPQHVERLELLTALSSMTDLKVWGYLRESLIAGSALSASYMGEAWGRQVFEILSRSKMTVNMHGSVLFPAQNGQEIDACANFANNMRLFEATGCGTLLITDYKENLNELFVIGEEVVAYRSLEECVELVRYFNVHQDEAAQIAARGQKRALEDHTYEKRMMQTAEILDRCMTKSARQQGLRSAVTISSGYAPTDKGSLTREVKDAWLNAEIPLKQRHLVESELQQMHNGAPAGVFKALAELLYPYVAPKTALLEVGCSSGYYSEVLEFLLMKELNYCGVDISPGMIDLARKLYPRSSWQVCDGARLPFQDREFHTVISGGVLLHVENYIEHIRETCRVSEKYVVAHRTPICRIGQTQLFTKLAYDVPTLEFRFNELDFVESFKTEGFEVMDLRIISSSEAADDFCLSYLFRRE